MKKRITIASGIVALIAVLAGAAYVAGRLMKRPVPSGKGNVITMGSGGQTLYQVADIDIEHAKELPDRPSDVTGLMTGVENNSIYVGVGAKRDLGFSATGSEDYDASDFDAIVEVVVTRDTEVYRDVTGVQVLEPGQELDTIRQEVAPLTLDDMSGQGLIMAWGERRGDRLIADVVLCRIGC